MSERYSAFLSYSHADQKVASWLHRRIESYRFPRALRGHDSAFGPVPKRLPHVFRDRDELPASGDLGAELRAALADARFQIVLCSPHSAHSRWVNEEILSFKRLHGEERTLALILDGEPFSGGKDECFPPALRFKLGPEGELSDVPAEPIAADIRKGKDGSRLALLKLLAGIAGVPLDALARRDASRRQRRLALLATASSTIAIVTIGLAIYAETQRRAAVEQREMAQSSLDFLIGTFEVANPAKENPRTITALTILDRASKRAELDFAKRPPVAASLLRTTGGIYLNLGLPKEAERDLQKALKLEPTTGVGRADTLLELAKLANQARDAKRLEKYVDAANAAAPAGGSEHARLAAEIARQRGYIAYLKGDYRQSAALLREADRMFADLPGDQRDERAIILTREAQALDQTHDLAQSQRFFDRAAALLLQLYGPQDVRYARSLQNAAFARFEAGSVDPALERMQRSLAIYRRVLDPDHPTLAIAQLLLGRIQAAKGNFAGARAAFDEARRIYVKLYGPDNSLVGDTEFYAADAEGAAGQTGGALALVADVKRIYDLNYGPDDPDQAELMLLRARILQRASRLEEAERECHAALALQLRLRRDPATLSETRSYCSALK